MNNKAVVVEWIDDINPKSYVPCLEHYGIKILHEIEIDENKTEVTFYGPVDSINKFLADCLV